MASRSALQSLQPTPSRPLAKAPEKVVRSLAALERQVGGRDALVAALSHAPKSRDLDYILGLVGDPRHDHTPLADLCAQGGITAGELIDAYKSGEINRAQALATSKVGAQLHEVAADTMRLALPHSITCTTCRGTGTVTPEPTRKVPNPQPVPCEDCGGAGVLDRQGDLEHKKLALDMGKLLSKGHNLSLTMSQQVGLAVGTTGGALEQLQAATDQILYGGDCPGPVVEAEEVGGRLEAEDPADPDAPYEEGDWHEDQGI